VELQDLTDRRSALWLQASECGDPGLAKSVAELSERIEDLWMTYRWLRSAICHGSHERIRAEARRHEDLLRHLRAREARERSSRREDLSQAAAGQVTTAAASSRSKKRTNPS
jgi:hypothetical protein